MMSDKLVKIHLFLTVIPDLSEILNGKKIRYRKIGYNAESEIPANKSQSCRHVGMKSSMISRAHMKPMII